MESMIWAAVSGETARITKPAMTRLSQASNGILPRVIPGQRMEMMVVMKLTAVPMLPKPETSKASDQKSVLCPWENTLAVSGA